MNTTSLCCRFTYPVIHDRAAVETHQPTQFLSHALLLTHSTLLYSTTILMMVCFYNNVEFHDCFLKKEKTEIIFSNTHNYNNSKKKKADTHTVRAINVTRGSDSQHYVGIKSSC
jgi:hypothetical protein